jgi:hypothetical protein
MKRNKMGGAWALIGKKRIEKKYWWEKLKEKVNLDDLGFDGRIILNFILKKMPGRYERGSCGSEYQPVVGSLKAVTKLRIFLDSEQLLDFKKDPASQS